MRNTQVLSVGAALEAVEPLDHAEPGLLDDLVGRGIRGHVEARHPLEAGAELVDDPREGSLVARAESFEYVGVGSREPFHPAIHCNADLGTRTVPP
jgi:hypothetical protein